MKNNICIYRNFNFDGNIYVKMDNKLDFIEIDLTLYKDGHPHSIQKTKNNVAIFKENLSGVYKIKAEILLKTMEISTIESKEIIIKNEPLRKTTKKNAIKKITNEIQPIYDNIKNYYLSVEIYKNNLAQLSRDVTKYLSDLQGNHNVIKFEKIPDNFFYERTRVEQYKIKLTNSPDELINIFQEIKKLDYVVDCYITPDTTNMAPPVLPSSPETKSKNILTKSKAHDEDDEPTPDFIDLQGYLQKGQGMNVLNAWNSGVTGQFATVRHLDYGVYHNHEDLKGNITVVNSRSEDEECDHGTASTGCIAAINNESGVTGIAYDCSFYFYDTGDLDLIASDVVAGDIVSLDIQFEKGGKLFPAIDNKSWWTRIRDIVDKGAVVILAAGNGYIDLSPENGEINDFGDSGSMLVGACYSETGTKATFSNYNHYTSLINSWGGWDVVTTGYGTLQEHSGHDRNYCNDFAGTSSATPLSSGALALIQSYAMESYGIFFDAFDMRDIIRDSGYDEGVEEGIGHRPNILAAMDKIDEMLS